MSQEFIKLQRENINECINILSQAFSNDPMINSFFGGKNKLKHTYTFFKYIVLSGVSEEELAFGLLKDSRLVCTAIVERPVRVHGIRLLLRPGFLINTLLFTLLVPLHALKQLNEIIKFTCTVRPDAPHYYLHFVGVRPELQRNGLGTQIMKQILEIVDKDPNGAGIGLDTTNVENLPFYESLGYRLVSQKEIGQMTIYYMFRDKSGASCGEKNREDH